MRADPTTGIAPQFGMYTGKDDADSLGSKVVKKFTEILKEKKCLADFYTFFTSEQLMQDLFDDGIFAVYTVGAQRRGVLDTLKKEEDPGMHTLHVKKNVAAMQWQDKVGELANDHSQSQGDNIGAEETERQIDGRHLLLKSSN